MRKILYLSAILVSVFYSVTANAAVHIKPVNSSVCEKYFIKGNNISVKCDFPKSKMHISTILSGSVECFGETCREIDLDEIHFTKLIILKNNKKSQEINLGSIETYVRLSMFTEAVKFMDLNFDGYDDIQLYESPTAGVNATYVYWLYNPKTRLFDATDLGKKLFGYDVTPDIKTKTINIKSHSGCCYNWNTTYHWVGNELRKKVEIFSGSLLVDAYGQVTSYYNDNEEILREEIDPNDWRDEHNERIGIKSYILKLKEEEKNGNYILKKNGDDKYTVIYNKPTKQKNN